MFSSLAQASWKKSDIMASTHWTMHESEYWVTIMDNRFQPAPPVNEADSKAAFLPSTVQVSNSEENKRRNKSTADQPQTGVFIWLQNNLRPMELHKFVVKTASLSLLTSPTENTTRLCLRRLTGILLWFLFLAEVTSAGGCLCRCQEKGGWGKKVAGRDRQEKGHNTRRDSPHP